MIAYLLSEGVDAQAPDNFYQTALFYAARDALLPGIKLLTPHCDLNHEDLHR